MPSKSRSLFVLIVALLARPAGAERAFQIASGELLEIELPSAEATSILAVDTGMQRLTGLTIVSSTQAFAVSSNPSRLLEIDLTTGQVTLEADLSFHPSGLTWKGSWLFSTDGLALHRVDPTTGSSTVVGPHGTRLIGLSTDARGSLYGVASTADGETALVTVDPATGSAATLGTPIDRGTALQGGLAITSPDTAWAILDLCGPILPSPGCWKFVEFDLSTGAAGPLTTGHEATAANLSGPPVEPPVVSIPTASTGSLLALAGLLLVLGRRWLRQRGSKVCDAWDFERS